MFQTGSQINPSLGRTDYSAYAQGAIAGGQAIGQGIANLGQGIASGIEQYAKQKKENKIMEGKLKASISSLEGFRPIADNVSPEASKQLTKTLSELNSPDIPLTERLARAEAATGTLTQLINFGIKEKEKADTATATNLALASAQSKKPIPSIYSSEILASAGKQALEFAATQAQIDETKAKTAATGVKKTPPEYQYYLSATPEERALLDKRRQAGANTTQLTTVPGIKVKIFEDLQGKRDKVLSLGSTKAAYKDALEAIEQGAFSGAGAEAKTALAKVGQLLGFNNWDNEIAASEFYRSRLAQPVFDLAQSFKGALSDSDRIFLQKSALGDIKYSPDSIKRMLILSERLETEARKTYLKDIKRIYGNSKEASDVESFRALSFDDQEISGLLPNQGGAQPTNYGTRADGTNKGSGFLGEIKLPNGQIATEVSIGANINGKEVEIPTLVPALTAEQRDFIAKGGNPLTRQDIVRTAIEHASKRIAAGLSPFNEPAAGSGNLIQLSPSALQYIQ